MSHHSKYFDGLDLPYCLPVQSVPENKHIHSGAEVSIRCMLIFWNKAFFNTTKEIPIGS